MATEQLNLYPGQNIFEEAEPKKLRWEKSEGNWRAAVFKTKKEHQCAKCENIIPKDSHAVITLDFEGLKPKDEDFRRIQYWHPPKVCPELPIEHEPIG